MNPSSSGKASRLDSRAIVVAGIVLVLLAAAVFGFRLVVDRSRIQSEISQQLAAIRAVHEPVTSEDLLRLYPDPPPERDALLLLRPVFEKSRDLESATNLVQILQGAWPKRKETLSDATKANLEAFITFHSAALAEFPDEAIKGAWFPTSSAFPKTNETLFSTNRSRFVRGPLMRLGEALDLQALQAMEAGQSTNAALALERSLKLASAFRGNVSLDYLIRRLNEKRICEILERALNQLQFSATELASLSQALADDRPEALLDSLLGERCSGIWVMDSLVRTTSNNPFLRLSGLFYRNSDFSTYLKKTGEQIAALRLPPKERLARLEELERNSNSTNSRPANMSRLFLPDMRVGLRAKGELETLTRKSAARTALAVERWRLAHEGGLPGSLNDLVPSYLPTVPSDPFNDQPLQYKKVPNGYLIYSIGADLTDDAGKEMPTDAKNPEHYDITFTVER